MQSPRQRRSRRLALTIPIRVYGIDYKGTDFSEDSTTVVVNWHGTKIRLVRQLLPDQEVCLFRRATMHSSASFPKRPVTKIPIHSGDWNVWSPKKRFGASPSPISSRRDGRCCAR